MFWRKKKQTDLRKAALDAYEQETAKRSMEQRKEIVAEFTRRFGVQPEKIVGTRDVFDLYCGEYRFRASFRRAPLDIPYVEFLLVWDCTCGNHHSCETNTIEMLGNAIANRYMTCIYDK